MSVAAWRAQGRHVDVCGRKLFVVERGPAAGEVEAPTIAILHGFPSWSADFAGVLDRFAQRFRVVVHDHLGFGLSEKRTEDAYSLFEQAELALALWQQLGIQSVHLLAHDYGTSVCTEILARRERVGVPVQVESVTLTNGSVHLELAHLLLSQHLLRSPTLGPIYAALASRGLFVRAMRRIMKRPVADEIVHDMYDALEHDGGRARLPSLARYIDERMRFQPRWVGALTRLDVPAHVLWADEDPIAVRAIGDALAGEIGTAGPRAQATAVHTRLAGLGHYPMVEDPVAYADAALAFWSQLARTRSAQLSAH
jgi:pimeloyl-ACP methyl ester carboxylesterase